VKRHQRQLEGDAGEDERIENVLSRPGASLRERRVRIASIIASTASSSSDRGEPMASRKFGDQAAVVWRRTVVLRRRRIA
jgi:hypothetical protein